MHVKFSSIFICMLKLKNTNVHMLIVTKSQIAYILISVKKKKC